ncbi:NAD(P)H-dependent glycerol-3-phosphate dehydrogenase [Cardinium endosymbiont of Oedothorax gibbosus]|uniref:NAD(P)H-dependent glycerol-3-phosphate dehydrogenase n=1 Tax=Cardinium endosymbiont of Oedothorax gibbosus TaxID=931101 RepID=UPI002023F69C|nr:NAD(P)H-dependent glycerol-3-phosphate dehydrogenase [Cardinium endosymbiont of Oedothorax gibbosus]CAH2559984.1 Glycerol-3-phosphate dehydrogenase [NAD(P)+] [Cardinium endosymbiont of Oedothorax gibbosus]
MASKYLFRNKVVAVLGAGKFGTAVANLVAPNVNRVCLYMHKAEHACAWQISRSVADQLLSANVVVTNDLVMVLRTCSVIFPVVPAAKFRGLMQQIASDLRPDHILIHGTKGFDFAQDDDTLTRRHVATMSEVIMQETVVQQIGCLAGPNLSTDLVKKHPAVTVVASATQKVLSVGEQLLTNDWFRVYTTHDLLSVEVCSVLKNIFAIGAGIIGGMGYQSNTYAFFMTMAISEMRYIMTTMRISKNALLGPAGLGDLIATCGSTVSRNYTIGYRLANGETLADVLSTTKEVSEGVQTVKAIHQLMQSYGRKAPITEIIYRILFDELPLKQGLDGLFDV